MTHIPVESSVFVFADRLRQFAERNSYCSVSIAKTIGENPQLPACFNFSQQIQKLQEMIQGYARSRSQSQCRGISQILNALGRNLQDTFKDSQLLSACIPALEAIKNFAANFVPQHHVIRVPVVAQLIPQNSAPVAIEEDDAFDMVVADSFQDAIDRVYKTLDEEIYYKKADRLKIMDKLVWKLRNKSPWNGAFEDSNPVLFEVLPALMQGCLIHVSPSYEAYGESALTREEYAVIKRTNMQGLVFEFAKALHNQDLAPLALKLKEIGASRRKENERMVSLALSRREQVAMQLQLDVPNLGATQYARELQAAMDTESHLVIASAVSNNLQLIPNEIVARLLSWCSARGCLNEVSLLCSNREIAWDTYWNSLMQADQWEHNSVYEYLFSKYPHHQKDAAKYLLEAMAARGVSQAIVHMLSMEYPYGFSAKTIDNAFTNAFDQEHYSLFQDFFEGNVLPYDATIIKAFRVLCEDNYFEDLACFFTQEILAKIPDADLQYGFTQFCEIGDFAKIDLFVKEEMCSCLDEDQAIELMDAFISANKAWEELEAPFKTFCDSSLFPKLQDWRFVLEDCAKEGKWDLLKAILSKVVISQSQYEQILRNTVACRQWDILLKMLDHPNFQNFTNGLPDRLVGALLDQDGGYAVIQRVLAKQLPLSEDSLKKMFQAAALQEDLNAMRAILKRVNPNQFTEEEIKVCMSNCLAKSKMNAVYFLTRFQQARRFPADLIHQIYLFAAQQGDADILKIAFANRSLLTDVQRDEIIHVGLKNKRYYFVSEFCDLHKSFLSRQKLFSHMKAAVLEKDLEYLKFLFFKFKRQMTVQMIEAAHTEAEKSGNSEASLYLWEQIWHRFFRLALKN